MGKNRWSRKTTPPPEPEKPAPVESKPVPKAVEVEKKRRDIPALALGEKHFETPDGRMLVGPAKEDSILDPVTGNRVNCKR